MEKVFEMVTIHLAILAIILIFAFSIGRVFGRVETTLKVYAKMNAIISALKKVNELASLRGEDISKLSTDELIRRAENQIKIKDLDE